MEYYFATDDKLDRRKYAEFLKSMLENCDMYRREDSDGAYVIAIDSPWGTGKTRFAKMLRNSLEGREPRVIDGKADQSFIPPAKEDRKFNVIYYNSWETDYWNDAIEPLMDSILNSEAFTQFRKDKKNKEAWDNLFRFAKGVLKASGYALASKAFGETSVGIFKEGLSESKKKAKDPLETFKKKSENYIEFRKALEQVIAKTGKKLVVIVDELDRCRPTFAIQTLELAKHLFSVEGSIFIFSLDIKQLSNSVKTVYGQELDAAGYLCRFFDYSTGLPNVNIQRFIEDKLVAYKCYSKKKMQLGEREFNELYQKVTNLLCVLAYESNLSLRDITTIIASIKILNLGFLWNYKNHSAHLFYIFLLFLKYKHSDLYIRLTSEKAISTELSGYINEKIGFILRQDLLEQISQLNDKYLIGSKHHNIYTNEKIETRNAYIRYVSVSSSNSNVVKMQLSVGTNSKDDIELELDGSVSIDKTIFLPELSRWENIRVISLSKLIRQQLEMFNFALPADAPEANT